MCLIFCRLRADKDAGLPPERKIGTLNLLPLLIDDGLSPDKNNGIPLFKLVLMLAIRFPKKPLHPVSDDCTAKLLTGSKTDEPLKLFCM